jgi:hypothetical protein
VAVISTPGNPVGAITAKGFAGIVPLRGPAGLRRRGRGFRTNRLRPRRRAAGKERARQESRAVCGLRAWAGILAGLSVALMGLVEDAMRPPLGSVVLFMAAALCLGGAIHLYLHRTNNVKSSDSLGPVQADRASRNQMGNVHGNKGVVTQGQTGDNAISK